LYEDNIDAIRIVSREFLYNHGCGFMKALLWKMIKLVDNIANDVGIQLSTAHMLRITIDQAHKELVCLISIENVCWNEDITSRCCNGYCRIISRGVSVCESKHQCSEHFLLKFSIEKHHS
jgi:hypothetical protein